MHAQHHRPTLCCSRSIRWLARKSRFNLSRYAHLLAILVLAASIAGLAYLLINEDRALQRDALTRDVDTVAQSLSLRLQAITEATTSIGLEIGDAKYNEGRFASTGRELMMSKPELLHLAYVDSKNRVRWSVQSPSPLADCAPQRPKSARKSRAR